MAIILPPYASKLSVPMQANNFIAYQSAKLAVSNSAGTGSASVTFNAVSPSTRTTLKITNSGTKGAYLASGVSTATAVASTTSALPTTGTYYLSNCDYIAAGAILQQDYIAGTDTLAAICAGTDTTTLEVSIGSGQ